MSENTTTASSVENNNEEPSSPFPPLKLEGGNPAPYRIIIAVLLLGAIGIAIYAWNLGTGTLRQPGPGLWIFIVAVLIVLAIPAAYLVKEKFEVFELQDVKRAVIMVGGLAAFVALYPLAGFYVAGLVGLIIITRWSAEESWRSTLIISTVTPAVVYLLFGVMFQVALSILPSWM